MKNYQEEEEEEEEEEVEFVPNAWSWELPADILGLIADKLSSLPLSEFIRFWSVCLGWRSFSIENYQHIKSPNKLPVLLIPIPPSLLLTDHHKKKISFSLSSSPSDDDDDEEEDAEELELEAQLVVFGIYGHNRLAFCRPGDKAWTRLDFEKYRQIHDVICYKGQFYAILQMGYVFAFVLDATRHLPMPIVTLEISPPEEVDPFLMGQIRRYLVESGGDLLQIRRNVDFSTPAESGRPYPLTESDGYITRQFLVFKLDPTRQWVEMKTLDDRMLFIGASSSMSLSASDFPGCSTPNSIYYTDDFIEGFVLEPLEGPHDIGIFNLEDGSFERHYKAESMTVMPPPIWIQPML